MSTLTKSQKQWLWFVALWCLGFASVSAMAFMIKLIMKLG